MKLKICECGRPEGDTLRDLKMGENLLSGTRQSVLRLAKILTSIAKCTTREKADTQRPSSPEPAAATTMWWPPMNRVSVKHVGEVEGSENTASYDFRSSRNLNLILAKRCFRVRAIHDSKRGSNP